MAPAHILPPIFEQIVDDEELAQSHMRVWRAALRFLDWVEPKPLKLDLLERATKVDRANLSRLVGRLVERGYLVRDGREPRGGAWRYRVPLARAAEATAAAAGDEAPAVPSAPRVFGRGL